MYFRATHISSRSLLMASLGGEKQGLPDVLPIVFVSVYFAFVIVVYKIKTLEN